MIRRAFPLSLWLALLAMTLPARAQLPIITKQPQSVSSGVTSNVTFRVEVASVGVPARFQWSLNGTLLPGQTNDTFSIQDVARADGGLYKVAVFNPFGVVDSEPALLRLVNFPLGTFKDNFVDREYLPQTNSFTGTVRGNNFGATAQAGEPNHSRKPARRSVWVKWRAPFNGRAIFSSAGSGLDSVLAIYTGTNIGSLTPVAADDDLGGFLTSQVSFNAVLNTDYHIAVDGFGGAQGEFLLAWNLLQVSAPMPNILLEPTSQSVAPLADASFTVGAEANSTFQWFFNNQPVNGQSLSNLVISSVNTNHVGDYFCRVLRGGQTRDSRIVRLQINVNGAGQADPFVLSSEKLFDSLLRATNPTGGSLSGSPAKSAGATSVAKSVAHGFSGTQILSTLGSTLEPDEMHHCGIVGGASEWFTVQADADGTLFINTDGSSFDTVLAVYVGPGDSFLTLTNVACDNDSGLDGKDSKVSFPAKKDVIYYVAVDGVNSPSTGLPARGTVRMNYRLVQPLTLTSVAYTNTSRGRLTFRVNSTPNLLTIVEASTNLNVANWLPLFTSTPPSGFFNFTNTNATAHPARFFRAVNRF